MWRVLQGDGSFVFTDIALLFALFYGKFQSVLQKAHLNFANFTLQWQWQCDYSCSGLHVIIVLCTAEFDDAQNDV